MITFDLNWWAVLAAVAVNVLVGFAWYSKGLFGTRWMQLIGKTEADLQTNQGAAMGPMPVLAALGAFILANVIAWAGAQSVLDGILVACWVWLGLYAAPVLMQTLFERRPMALFWIEAGYTLVTLAIAGGIFAVWV